MMTDDETAIHELVYTWFKASKAGDLATIMNLMTDDVVFMVPGAEPFGKAAFARTFTAMKDVSIEGSSKLQELMVLGNWAWLRNQIDITITPANGGAAMHRAGYTLTILRKEADGRWRLARDANLLAATV